MAGISIVWFRRDLRLGDNRAVHEALARGGAVVPVYVWEPEEEGRWRAGAASRFWLHQALRALMDDLEKLGSRLVVRRGPAAKVLLEVAREAGAEAVYWNRLYEPEAVRRDEGVRGGLEREGLGCFDFAGDLLVEPQDGCKKDGTPYLVFTPYAKACMDRVDDEAPLGRPSGWPAGPKLDSLKLDELELEPKIHWAEGIREAWEFGEAAGLARLRLFVEKGLGGYEETRNLPAVEDGVSRLSPYLHFGEVSSRQVWHAVVEAREGMGARARASADVFLKELLWREFSHHLLTHYPTMPEQPLKREFERYPWKTDERALQAWQRGQTGYPIVDAGMRQLWQTGWMHNRVRMIVGSFLIKDLGIAWQQGEDWFWDTLVDADLAQNAMNWQWVAGCGADASPFFRVFNPMTQGQKFDPTGDYVRRFVPEIAALPDKYLQAPWEAPAEVRAKAGLTLGRDYPAPMVDHARAREAALAAYKRL